MKAIYFDMDGTLVDFYSQVDWLTDLTNEYTRPYRLAKAMNNNRKLVRILNTLQEQGYHLGIVSWLSKTGTDEYNSKVTKAKLDWLKRHMGSIEWDEIKIVEYGTLKNNVVEYKEGILFDDEIGNRKEWEGIAFNEKNILEVLKALID